MVKDFHLYFLEVKVENLIFKTRYFTINLLEDNESINQ